MTLRQFDNGYWYATQLQDFGKAIGIPSAGKLRKDELERESQKRLPGLTRKSGVRYRFNRSPLDVLPEAL